MSIRVAVLGTPELAYYTQAQPIADTAHTAFALGTATRRRLRNEP
jgi:hypothetical protein